MKRFARLYNTLDASTSTAAKLEALRHYLAEAPPRDAAWAVYFLAGGRPRQIVPTATLVGLAQAVAGVPAWLFDECYQAVGDLAETIAHLLPDAPGAGAPHGLADWVEQRLLPLRGTPPEAQAERIAAWWRELDATGRFLLVKLIGGGLRVGVSRLLVQRALALHAGLDARLVAERMMGYTDKTARPDEAAFLALLAPAGGQAAADSGLPYPFFLAHPLPELPPDRFEAELGAPSDWLVEWKFDGIRAQVVRRAGRVWVWSRGEELVSDRFPEVVALAGRWPDGTVVDGEIVVWKDGRPGAFQLLQQRIGRKTLTRRVLAEAPAGFIAYDLLEWQGQDQRQQPQHERRVRLEALAAEPLVAASGLQLSPRLEAGSWTALAALRAQARERGVEGLMLKHRQSRYGVGRTKAEGRWWKWKIAPLTVDAVLIYAQAGHGRRASVYTDYTFAVWNRAPRDAAEALAVAEAIARREPAAPGALQLVAFAKAYSGLSDAEFQHVDRVVRGNTLDKFGPVRSVRPTLLFELGFEGIQRSTRHKSGVALRFPRMLRIRHDKPLHEADTLQTLQALLEPFTEGDDPPEDGDSA